MGIGNWKLNIAQIVSARELCMQWNRNVVVEILRGTSADSAMLSDYDGSSVTRYFADTERSIPSRSVRTSASDNLRTVDE